MKATAILIFSFFLASSSYAQFRYEKSSHGDPLTEIVDPTGMKQGKWNFTDSGNHFFRTETYRDNVLVSNLYYQAASAPVDLAAFRQKNISSFTQQPLRDLAQTLAAIGNGEIIILDDGKAMLHVYFDKVKNPSKIGQVDLGVLKNYPLKSTILFF